MAHNRNGNATRKNPRDSAQGYARLDLKVFPLRTAGDIKAPHEVTTEGRATKDGGHNAATANPVIIDAWWAAHPTAGVGMSLKMSGLVTIDVDPRHGGDKTFARLKAQYPGVFDTTVEAVTGGDGSHYVFAAESGKSYPGTLGDGVDVKHNGYIAVEPSPHPSGKHYAWVDGKSPEDGLAFLPTLSSDLCYQIKRQRPNKKGRANDRIEGIEADPGSFGADITDDRPLSLTEDQIRNIVFSIPNSGPYVGMDHEDYDREGSRYYDHWFEVICGIYHETDGSEEGRQIALEWSEQSPNHSQAEFDKKWPSAKHDNPHTRPVTFRSVITRSNAATKHERLLQYEHIHTQLVQAQTLDEVNEAKLLAKQLALENPLQRKALAATMVTAVKRITNAAGVMTITQAQKEIAYEDPKILAVPEWCRKIAFVTEDGEFVDTTDARRRWKREVFDMAFMRHAMTEEDIRSGASRPASPPSDLALTRYHIKIVDSRGYAPWIKDYAENPYYTFEGRSFLNTYTGRFAVKQAKSLDVDDMIAIHTYEALMGNVFGTPRCQALFESCMHHIIRTKQRIGWAPVLFSVEGTGKTLLFNLLTAMVGRNNVSTISGLALHEKFNAWAENRLIAFVEEVGGYDRKEKFDALNALKPVITNDFIPIRRMQRDTYDVPNTVNVFMTTNKADAFDMERDGGDTRLWFATPAFHTKDEVDAFKRKNPHFYPNVVDAFTRHIPAIKRHILAKPYHADFNPGGRAPYSAQKQELIQAAKSETRLLIEDALKEGRFDVSDELLRVSALVDVCGELDPTMAVPEDRALSSLLKHAGFHRLDRVMINGKRDVYWTRKPRLFASNGDAAPAIRAYIAKHDDQL